MKSGWVMGVAGGVAVSFALAGRCQGNSPSREQASADSSARITWSDPIEVARGPGHIGPWRMNESEFHYVDDPTVAIDEKGRIAVAWADNEGQDVYFRSYGSGGQPRGEAVNVSRTPDVFSWLPRLVVAREQVFVLWQEIVFSGGSHGGEILFSRSTDGGARFESPVNLSRTEAGAGKGRLTRDRWDNGSLDLERAPNGTLIAAWTEYEGRLYVARSTDGGVRFSAPEHVGGSDERPFRAPALAVTNDNRVHLAFTEGDTPRANIQVVISQDGGETFEDALAVLPNDRHQDAPKLAADREGALHLVYAQRPPDSLSGGRIMYSRRAPEAQSFEEPRLVSSSAADAPSAAFPHLAVDGDGRVQVMWEESRAAGQRARSLQFTVSLDGGRRFAAPAVVPGSDDPALGPHANLQGGLARKLAVASGGTWAAVSSHLREGEESRIQLWRATMNE